MFWHFSLINAQESCFVAFSLSAQKKIVSKPCFPSLEAGILLVSYGTATSPLVLLALVEHLEGENLAFHPHV